LFEFLISSNGRTIEYHRLQQATTESLTTYLLGQVLSFPLLSFGFEPLHATAVVIDGEAIAFLGDCGDGKSTLGAAFVARGFPILTDDVLALEARDGRWIAHAGPARLKLFPTVAEKVLGRGNGRQMNPGTSKLVLQLSAGQASEGSLPLRALYVLNDPVRRPTPTVSIAPLSGQQAFLALIQATFNVIQVDRARLANQFSMATRLAAEVPLRRLTYPRKLSSLDAVCQALLTEGASRTATASRRHPVPAVPSPLVEPLRHLRVTAERGD
jgi:hypothetical protein